MRDFDWSRFRRRLVTWGFYVVLASLLPVGFLGYELVDEDKLHGWSDLLGNGEVIIIAIVIAAGAVGDLLSHERRKMLSNAALINAFMAFVVAAIGSLVYGRTTVRTRNAPTEDVNKLAAQLTHTTMASVALFAVSLIVGLCTIFLNTWEEKNSQ